MGWGGVGWGDSFVLVLLWWLWCVLVVVTLFLFGVLGLCWHVSFRFAFTCFGFTLSLLCKKGWCLSAMGRGGTLPQSGASGATTAPFDSLAG